MFLWRCSSYKLIIHIAAICEQLHGEKPGGIILRSVSSDYCKAKMPNVGCGKWLVLAASHTQFARKFTTSMQQVGWVIINLHPTEELRIDQPKRSTDEGIATAYFCRCWSYWSESAGWCVCQRATTTWLDEAENCRSRSSRSATVWHF